MSPRASKRLPLLVPPALGRRRAVTFMEILVVLVIMSVLMAMMAPTMKGLHNRNRLSAASREITNVLRYARQQAVLRNHATDVLFKLEENTYELVLNPPDTLKRRSYSSRKPKKEDMERKRELDPDKRGITFHSIETGQEKIDRKEGHKIRFLRNGSASASTIVIQFKEKNKEKEPRLITIQVANSTGAVRVYRGGPQEIEIEIPEWGTKDNESTPAPPEGRWRR